MKSLGELPSTISASKILQTIGENIIIADTDYNIVWLNGYAAQLMSHVVPLFGIRSVADLIGMNMNRFHHNPVYQRNIMDNISHVHRTRINIKNTYIADIVINPIKEEDGTTAGYVVMLMDVTTKAQEEYRTEKLLRQLSVPLLQIWDQAIAIPLIGDLDKERVDILLAKLLSECQAKEIAYVLLDLSEITGLKGEIDFHINRISECLRLMGTECIIVGITPKLAAKIVKFENNIPTFSTTKLGIQYMLNKESGRLKSEG